MRWSRVRVRWREESPPFGLPRSESPGPKQIGVELGLGVSEGGVARVGRGGRLRGGAQVFR